jgi:hypothetical protein
LHATGTLAGLINSRSLGDTIGASCGVICEADVKRIEFRRGPMVFNAFDPCISLDYWGLVNLGVNHPKFNGPRLLKWIEMDICWYRCVDSCDTRTPMELARPGPARGKDQFMLLCSDGAIWQQLLGLSATLHSGTISQLIPNGKYWGTQGHKSDTIRTRISPLKAASISGGFTV